jgi:signal transduction histidine kinase
VSNRRSVERRQTANALRENALTILAHDLRSPLSTIMMAADLLSEIEDPGRRQHFIDIIQRAARQADFLIHDLLDVTVIENGALHIQCSSEPAAYLIDSVCELFEASASGAGLLFACDTSTVGNTHIDVDSPRFVQLLSNLISNAIKFTPAGGSVLVSANIAGDMVRINVRDTGIGIDTEEIPHVFERFWQASHHHRAGAGLGLAIARGIVQAHGGEIGVASEPGAGSTFFFTIPVAPVPSDIRSNQDGGHNEYARR